MRVYHFAYFILSILAGICLTGCASQSTPQGGPIDSMPPLIKSTIPLPYSTNFVGKKVILDFDEFIQLKDQQKLFFISPEALAKPLLSIKGRSVVVEFKDTLLPDQTYRLDFGSSIVDNNEGNKLDGFTFTLSTGNYIDSLVMVGQLLDAQTRDTIVGGFVPFYDMVRDSTYAEQGLDSTLFKSRAEVLVRSDSSGYFVADILRDKSYRIYAIVDNNSNQRYETATDMVGFLDSTYNPIDMPPFSFGYDSLRRRMIIDTLQLTIELFPEKAVKRQNLQSQNRPRRNQLELIFSAENASIDSLLFDSIPAEWLLEHRVPTGDTVTYWIAPPDTTALNALPDTIKGRMVYQRQDSVMQFYGHSVDLIFAHTIPQEKVDKKKSQKTTDRPPKEEKEPKKSKKSKKSKTRSADQPQADSTTNLNAESPDPLPADSTAQADTQTEDTAEAQSESQSDTTAKTPEVNPFTFKVEASTEMNPKSNIILRFDQPLMAIDSSVIELYETITEQIKGARRGDAKTTKETQNKIPIHLRQDDLRTVTLYTDWKDASKYELVIPAAAFSDILFQSNDTLKSSFSTLDPEKFGTIFFDVAADTLIADKEYIFELVTISGQKWEQTVVERTLGVRQGDRIVYRFLQPNNYYLRVTEDTNHDGKWTSGDLRKRTHAEKVRFLSDNNQRQIIIAKENWEVGVGAEIDLAKLMDSR